MAASSLDQYGTVSCFAPVGVVSEPRADGSTVLRNAIWSEPGPATLPERLRHWATVDPTRPYLSEIVDGALRRVTYGETLATVRRWSAALAGLGLTADRPLAIVAGNGVNHALLMLAAQNIGAPAAVVTPAYAFASAAPYAKFAKIIGAIEPGLVVADAVDDVRAALTAVGAGDVTVQPIADMGWLDAAPAIDRDELA